MRQLLIFWFNRQLGGFTGDCLGAAQQLLEVAIYVILLVLATKPTLLLTSKISTTNFMGIS
jgi:adenosylcobinamide-GDP ribazoletransferase